MDMSSTAETQEKKWGEAAIAAGFTVLPNHLIAINQFLEDDKRISPTEMLVALQILTSWWAVDKMPFPSKTTIAKRAALSPRQVQRALAALEDKGYIKRITRMTSNRARISNQFDVSGLASAVAAIASKHPAAFKKQSKVEAE
jgi:hypothetical protein